MKVLAHRVQSLHRSSKFDSMLLEAVASFQFCCPPFSIVASCIPADSILILEHPPKSNDIDSCFNFDWFPFGASSFSFRFFFCSCWLRQILKRRPRVCVVLCSSDTQFARHCRSATSCPRFFTRRIQWGFLIFFVVRMCSGWHYSISFLLSPPLSTALIRIRKSLP